MKLILLAIFEGAVQRHRVHLHRCVPIASTHPRSPVRVPNAESLSPLTSNAWLPTPGPASRPPTFCLCLTPLGISFKWTRTVFVLSCWLASLSIMSPRFIHSVACVRVSSLLRAERYSVVCPHPIVLIHPSTSRHLGGFHVLATVSNSAMNMVYKYLFENSLPIPLDIHSKAELLDHMVILLSFWKLP